MKICICPSVTPEISPNSPYSLAPAPSRSGPPTPEISEALRRADPTNILHGSRIHPELARRVSDLIEAAARKGMNLRVVEGYRDLDRQTQLLASGRGVTKAKAGLSFHNYGLAVDIAFRDAKGRPSWDERHDWKTLGALGKQQGLVWGGDWKHLVDRTHFQLLPNDQISRVRDLTRTDGLQKMWEKIR